MVLTSFNLFVFPLIALLVDFVLSDNITMPVAALFYSAPDLQPIVLNVTLNQETQVSPGYIFLAPYQVPQGGPYIFKSSGELVWDGHGTFGISNSHNFFVCPYHGTDHLCLYEGDLSVGYARGQNLIIDNSFRIVESIHPGNGKSGSDMHEFNFVDNGKSVLLSIYEIIPYDMFAYNITNGLAFLQVGGFQRIEIDTGKVLFDWTSIGAGVEPAASYVLPGTTDVSGDGSTPQSAWDYFHINAIDMNSEGDYLVSGRHVEAIYKISGQDGSILWELGGKTSSFQQNFNFSYQHDCRFISENSTTTIISFFDNASNGFNQSSNQTEGKVVALNNETMEATLLQAYSAPDGGALSASQGNLQILPNGNAFLGWGSHQAVSESLADGTPVYYADFATTGALQYRSFKFNFSSNPTTAPSLYTYAQNLSAPTMLYVSWNGATEVASWQFYGGATVSNLTFLGSTNKTGFETITTFFSFVPLTIAEAVASNGSALRNSTVQSTFVPGSQLTGLCNELQCPLSSGAMLDPGVIPLSSNVVVVAAAPAQASSQVSTTQAASATAASSASSSGISTCSSTSDAVVVPVRIWYMYLLLLAIMYIQMC